MTDKFQVSRVLREIASLLQVRGENAFKSRAYDVAADRIMGLPDDLGELVTQNRLQEVPGIGPKIAETISELVNTGKSSHHEKLVQQFGLGSLELMRIPELGPKKVAKLVELGFGDLATLETACAEGKLREVKGFGEKTEEKILHNIAIMKRSAGKYRLGTVLPLAEELLARVKAAPGVIRAEVAGSVRRRCEAVSDVDLVASASEAGPVLEAFSSHGEVAETLGRGNTKTSVRLRTGDIQVDLRVLPDEDFATALHHFTGSKAHHVKLRGLARQKGLTLSEYGLVSIVDAKKIPIEDEAALYKALGLSYIAPELREDWGEIEAALAGKLPELLQLDDVRGVVHSHSTWSDGRDSLEDMARAALAMGYGYLTVTEHSQTAFYAGGIKPDDLQRHWDEVDAVNEKVPGIKLLKGIETDILEDGSLDYDDKILEKMDVVIGSVHQRYKLDEDGMTKRILKAFDNPHLHIWGHATGRLIHKREPYALRMEEVLDKAAEKRIAIEINGNPERLDLKADYVRLALERGIRLTVSADSHSTRELNYLQFAVDVARKGWAGPEHILNTLPVERFTAELKSRR
ncbi:MAG: DNA polymerase/3'-5' exonuclease PolX [Myxococcaceae bacterium]